MRTYRILYYSWNENTFADAYEALQKLGHTVLLSNDRFEKYDEDEIFMQRIDKMIADNKVDVIFSFNYFPDLSRCALKAGILYISWCYDSPLLTLQSVTLRNAANRIFLFDRANCEKLRQEGFTNIFYMPMACNVERVERQLLQDRDCSNIENVNYKHDITFLGSLYNDEFNFYQQIKYLPDYLRGYLDAAMEAQMPIYGYDMVGQLVNEQITNDVLKYIKLEIGDYYRECKRDILISMLQKQITANERKRLLTVIGENYNLDLYSPKRPEGMRVNYCGIADYQKEMPEVFRTSKINLNITLRTILSGMPLRVIDVLGAGGFLITNYQSDLEEYFVNGKDLVWYGSYEELFEQINYYLNHEEERKTIAMNGQRIVQNCLTYEWLFRKIFKEID